MKSEIKALCRISGTKETKTKAEKVKRQQVLKTNLRFAREVSAIERWALVQITARITLLWRN